MLHGASWNMHDFEAIDNKKHSIENSFFFFPLLIAYTLGVLITWKN